MIQQESRLKTADNTGVKEVLCIRVLRNKKCASIGDTIVVTAKRVKPGNEIKKGHVCKAIVVRTKKSYKRRDGTYIRFDDNAVVLLGNKDKIVGTRISGPIPREIRKINADIVSLAPETI